MDASIAGFMHSGDRFEQHGFPGARGTEKRKVVSDLDMEGNIVKSKLAQPDADAFKSEHLYLLFLS
jgi:hypothetical protein